jgi:hypothetical protein
MAFQDDKTAILTIIRSRDCAAASFIDRKAKNYDSLISMIFLFSKIFDCDTAYLDDIIASVDDAVWTANGVYNAKTGTTITNPRVLINSTYDDVVVDTNTLELLLVTSGSHVGNLNVTGNTLLDLLTIQGGSTIDHLGVATDGSCINCLYVRCCSSSASHLTKVGYGSNVKNFSIDECAVYGGVACAPSVTPLPEISGVSVSDETGDGFQIDWTLPGGGVTGVMISYRREGELDWKIPNHLPDPAHATVAGTFDQVIFTLLDAETTYEILIQTTDGTNLSEGTIVTAITTLLV